MATYTAGDQIKRALRLLGVLADGENPSASEMYDGLISLNQMLDSWSTERLSVYGMTDNVFTWPAGQVTQSIGPTGDFVVTPGPFQIDPATYYVVNNISYPIPIINQEQYNSIPLKSATSTLPQVLFVNRVLDITNIITRMYLYPVPSQNIEFHFISVAQLTEATDELTELIFPQGYMRAFAYNLAMEMAPEYGIEPSRQVIRIATTSKRNIKRINNPNDVMSFPFSVMNNGVYNVYTGSNQ